MVFLWIWHQSTSNGNKNKPVELHQTKGFLSLAQMIKNLLIMQETQVWVLDQDDPLEMEMATPSSILARRIPWTEGPGGLQSMGSQTAGHSGVTNTFTFTHPTKKLLHRKKEAINKTKKQGFPGLSGRVHLSIQETRVLSLLWEDPSVLWGS